MNVLYFMLWYIVGLATFIYWVTKEYDLTLSILPLLFFCGFGGPFNFIVGWLIHGDTVISCDKILFKKRK